MNPAASHSVLPEMWLTAHYKKEETWIQNNKVFWGRETPHSHHCYNCSILLLTGIVNLLTCLFCKSTFIIGIYVQEKHSLHRV